LVPQDDLKNFVEYSLAVCKTLDAHHDGEETDFFPMIEEQTGNLGLMSANVEQHGVVKHRKQLSKIG